MWRYSTWLRSPRWSWQTRLSCHDSQPTRPGRPKNIIFNAKFIIFKLLNDLKSIIFKLIDYLAGLSVQRNGRRVADCDMLFRRALAPNYLKLQINGHFSIEIIVFQGQFSVVSVFSKISAISAISGIYIAIRTRIALHVMPASSEVLTTMSFQSWSALENLRPSQKQSNRAGSIGCFTSDGMRKV